jgi:hypothetical protein
MMIKNKMESYDKDLNQVITSLEFQEMLQLPDYPHLCSLLYESAKYMSSFIGAAQGLTFHGLIRAMTLLNRERFGKLLHELDYLKLLFCSFAGHSITENDSYSVVFKATNLINWDELPLVKAFNESEISDVTVKATDLLDIIAFLLVISRYEPTESLESYDFTHLDRYKHQGLNVLRAMNPEITLENLNIMAVSFNGFKDTITNVAPNLFSPMKSLLEQLLFDTITNHKEIITTSKLINEFTLAQLSTFLPLELVYSKIRKLYIGSESGFSMRSFESKVFKWNAPTILLIKGKRIGENHNQRYKRFEENYPKYKGSTPSFEHHSDEIVYGVYIKEPWKISNKDVFGSHCTTMFQMEPIQRIYKPTVSAKHFVYFNTLGGGIGIGSEMPKVKNGTVRYNPGNVSLVMDSTLEFAVFRHLPLGGEFKSLQLSPEYEDRIHINDVEVWGCGGEKELEEQNKQWEWEQNEVKRRQQINVKSMGEDRALLEMAGLIGQHQSGGSV